jgi:hypothetical protein
VVTGSCRVHACSSVLLLREVTATALNYFYDKGGLVFVRPCETLAWSQVAYNPSVTASHVHAIKEGLNKNISTEHGICIH